VASKSSPFLELTSFTKLENQLCISFQEVQRNEARDTTGLRSITVCIERWEMFRDSETEVAI